MKKTLTRCECETGSIFVFSSDPENTPVKVLFDPLVRSVTKRNHIYNVRRLRRLEVATAASPLKKGECYVNCF